MITVPYANFLYVPIMMGIELRLTAIRVPELCYQKGTPKVAKEAYDTEDARNPVCCHGNKFVTLRRIVFSLLIKIWSRVWRHDLANLCISKQLEHRYLWNEKRYLKITNNIYPLIQAT